VKAKCTLGVVVCMFRGVFLIQAFKEIEGWILVYTVSDKFVFMGKLIIRTYPPIIQV